MFIRNDPLISVGMPVLNCETTLELAIRSIVRQTRGEWELIIIDDGSRDRTVEICRSFADPRIRLLADGTHRGLSERLNEAIHLSKGKYFARMDGDDVAYPERFDRQVLYLEKHPDVDLLGAGILVFSGNGSALGTRTIWQTHEEICRRPWAGFYLPHPTWIGRTDWFRQSLYRPEAVRMEDQDLMLRTYRTSRFASMPEILLGYREDQFSLQKAIRGRYHFTKLFLSGSFANSQDRFFVLRGVAGQSLKAIAEIFAVIAFQTRRVLQHRALSVDARDSLRWEQVWRELANSEEGITFPNLVHK
jgi:glycosyltransferase involved in cell wall biosynthesis